jgi:protein TonB
MKTETFVVSSWDDLVFSNRNRSYGAYSVRKSYSKSMVTGLGISVSLVCLLILIPQIVARFQGSALPPEKPKEDLSVVMLPPPKVDPPRITPPPPPPPATQVQAPVKDLTPQVVQHEVETKLPTRDEIDAATQETTPGDGPVTVNPPSDPPPADNTDYNKDFISVQVQPVFKDGVKGIANFISRNTRYPSAARRMGVEGIVYVAFVVDKDGKVRDAKVIRGISAECDKEAVRVISSMDGWSPGQQNDRKVSVRMTLPIRFQMIH